MHRLLRSGAAKASPTVGPANDESEHTADRLLPEALTGRQLLAGHRVPLIQQRGNGSLTATGLQRTLGDGHDLRSPRFAGDPVLEACFDNERLLQFGSRGPAVEKVQQALIDAGFPLPVFGVDGIFKTETQAAVRDYQRAHGLKPDGIVGPITIGDMDALFAAPGPAPAPPKPAPTPPKPGPTPPKPAPAPPKPAPPQSIASETVALTPGARTRTKIGVGEEVKLTHSPGSAAWTTTGGTLSAASGVTVILTAPDTAQRITVTAGTTTLAFDVLAPDSVSMNREPGTGVKHTLNRADSGIQTRIFLGPDTVNFNKVIYHELDVAGTVTSPGAFSCNPASGGHCGAGGGGAACPDLLLTTEVVAGKGTRAVRGDCAYSGDCGTSPPIPPGSLTLSIPYEYKVGAGAFHRFAIVAQVHSLAADASTLNTDKAGAHGDTRVAATSVVIPSCP
jgi:peptidoglycan hydrolase-like protein with peptidoglycan-binding domain